jgi:hypothetical protein
MSILKNKFFQWCTSSLIGHLIFFETFVSVPLFVWTLMTMYQQHTLTVATALKIGLLCMVHIGIGAALLWYSFSSPLIRSRKDRR